jgi:type IV secretion system protein TrbL
VSVCDVPVIHQVCNQAGDAAGAVVTAPFDWLAQSMAGAAEWMFISVWKVIDTTTFVDVTSRQYRDVYSIIFGIAVFVMLGFFMLQVIGGMIRRESSALARAALGLAKSILGSFVALALLGTALEVTDQLCVGIVNAAGTNMDEMGDKLAVLAAGLGTISLSAPGAGAIVTIFLASLAICGAMVVWISLLMRKALLLIAIVFAPIALAGSSWDQTRSWVGRWVTFVIAMILSKVVLVVIFLLATAQVSAPIDADLESVSQPMAGVVLMLLAGFAPYLSYKAIAFMGFDIHHAMSAEQEGKASLNRPMPIPLSRLGGGASPARILGHPGEGASAGGSSPAPTGGGAGPAAANGTAVNGAAAGSGGASGAFGGAAGGGAAGGAAAAGLVAAGVVLAKEAAAAGPRLGGFVAAQAAGHAQSDDSTATSPSSSADSIRSASPGSAAPAPTTAQASIPASVPPPVADSTLTQPSGRSDRP